MKLYHNVLNLKRLKSILEGGFILKDEQITDPTKPCIIHDVIERFSGENLMKQQKHFVSLYGSDDMAQEKANSFAVGFGKACELICKDLQNGL